MYTAQHSTAQPYRLNASDNGKSVLNKTSFSYLLLFFMLFYRSYSQLLPPEPQAPSENACIQYLNNICVNSNWTFSTQIVVINGCSLRVYVKTRSCGSTYKRVVVIDSITVYQASVACSNLGTDIMNGNLAFREVVDSICSQLLKFPLVNGVTTNGCFNDIQVMLGSCWMITPGTVISPITGIIPIFRPCNIGICCIRTFQVCKLPSPINGIPIFQVTLIGVSSYPDEGIYFCPERFAGCVSSCQDWQKNKKKDDKKEIGKNTIEQAGSEDEESSNGKVKSLKKVTENETKTEANKRK